MPKAQTRRNSSYRLVPRRVLFDYYLVGCVERNASAQAQRFVEVVVT